MFNISTLPNGIRVVTAKLPTKTASSVVFTNVGSRYEAKEDSGISHFLEHMVFKGTHTRDAKTLSQEIERLGSDFNAFTSMTTTAYIVNGLGKHTNTALEVLGDIMLNSTFDPEELEREREVVIQEITMYDDDIGSVASSHFMATAFGDQPIGRDTIGTVDNVEGFTRDRIKQFFERHYHANEVIITGIGDIDHETYVKQAEAHFGSMNGGQANVYMPATYIGGQDVLIDDRFDQAHVHIGWEMPGAISPEFPVYKMLAAVIGGGMSSPLFQEVRERLGLCYSVWADLVPYREVSVFALGGATTPEHLEPFLTKSVEQLRVVADGGIEDADWERSINTVVFGLAKRDEKAMSIAQYVARDIFRDGYITTTDELIAQYSAVTKEQVIAAAKKLLTGRFTLSIAGNAEAKDYAAIIEEALK